MAIKDLTNARLSALKNNVKVLYDDLQELLATKTEQFSDFSSARKEQLAVEEQKENPSKYYHLQIFDQFIEIRHIHNSQSYVLYINKIDFSPAFVEDMCIDFNCTCEIDFNRYKFLTLSFENAVILFIQLCKEYLKIREYKQTLLEVY